MKALCPTALCFLTSFGVVAQDATLSLTVNVEDAEPNIGQSIVSLFSAENYLEMPLLEQIEAVDGRGRSVVIFRGLNAGEYAVSVVYDEDMDGELDTGLFRIPTEKIGFSNNARGLMGPASFDDASFELSRASTVITVNLDKAR
jgi:uncharacterized protein (DUF2141 family)